MENPGKKVEITLSRDKEKKGKSINANNSKSSTQKVHYKRGESGNKILMEINYMGYHQKRVEITLSRETRKEDES